MGTHTAQSTLLCKGFLSLTLLHSPSSSSSSSSSMRSPSPFSFSTMDTFLDLNIDPAPPSSAIAVALDSKRELEGEIYCDRAKLSLSSLPNDQESDSEQRMLEEELERKTRENEKLTEMVRVMYEKCMNLQKQVMCLVMQQKQNSEREEAALDHIRKRKLAAEEEEGDGYGGVCSRRDEEFHRWLKRPRLNANTKVSRVLVHTKASDPSLVVKDGYQWRKYGQKVTRDNPSPRAYYKCSSAPNCPVKKKVQRSVEDPTILVATYEGEHSHASHFQTELSLRSINGGKASTVPVLATIKPCCATVTLDLVEEDVRFNSGKEYTEAEVAAWQQVFVRQMASSLKKDPEFPGIVAGAISDKVLDQTNRE